MRESPRRKPIPFVVPAIIALLAGLWSGLIRLGWSFPSAGPTPPVAHGPLMIGGFIGTVIGLERAVALGSLTSHRWPYLVPALCGIGGLGLALGAPAWLGRGSIGLASLGLVAVFVVICRIRPDWPHVTMGLGAGAWLAGNIVWISGGPPSAAAVWWVGFLVMTIAGERLELARLVGRGARPLVGFASSLALLVAGLALSLVAFEPGLRLAGGGGAAMGLWLLRHDLARRTIRREGLTRFIAACLLGGYAWLVFAGALWLVAPARFTAGPVFDAMLHAVLVGFVLSMIFGHAPIILPAVSGAPVAYHPRFYAHLLLLHGSLLLRVAGDLGGLDPARRWGGLLNVAAILLFFANTLAAVALARRRSPAAGPVRPSPTEPAD